MEISLTEFVDFVLASGTPKLTAVKRIYQQHKDGYHPAKDYWKKMRDGIAEYHQTKRPETLDSICQGLDKNKTTNYPFVLRCYRKFLGRKDLVSFASYKHEWVCGDLVVRVNPELGLAERGKWKAYVKLYFKPDALSQRKCDTILHLMALVQQELELKESAAILDVRNSKLISAKEFDKSLTILLKGEAASFSLMYKSFMN